jgi:hypothetical protein
MEEQLVLEVDGRNPDEVEELNLDSCKATQIAGLTDKFLNLQTLSMTNNELTSLKGFPKLPNLRKLDLGDNRISSGFEPLAACPELEYISLSGNPIKDLNALEPLKKLDSLQTLEVFNCDIAQSEDYRSKIFDLLPNVVYVDGFDRDGEVAPDDDEYDDEEGASDEEDEDSEGEGAVGAADDDDEDDDEDDVSDDGSEEDEEETSRGTKRKHEDEENAGDDDA